MEQIKNNYFSVGFNDLHYVLQYDPCDVNSYNRVAYESQQVVEKLFKGIIELCDTLSIDDKVKLLRTHNLRVLGSTLNTECSVTLNLSDLAYLKDFYFEARYPGDDFVVVSKEERDQCVSIMLESIGKIKHLCKDVPESLSKLDAF